jgi:hypothetical protein
LTSCKSRPIDYQWEPQTAHFNRIKQLAGHCDPSNPLILSLISIFFCVVVWQNIQVHQCITVGFHELSYGDQNISSLDQT